MKTCRNSRCHAVADANDTVACLKTFLSEQGAGEQQIDLQPTDIDGRDTVIDISVAKTDLKPGMLKFVSRNVWQHFNFEREDSGYR